MKLQIFPIFLFLTTSLTFGQYSTPNTGIDWTLDDLAENSPSTITVDGDVYTLHETIVIMENDQLRLDSDLILKIAPDVEVEVRGKFRSDSDEVIITALDQDNQYEGFWFYDTSEGYFNNTRIEYGGGIRVVTGDFLIENSEVSNNGSGSSSGAAISFSNGSPIVRNSVFKFNENPAISSGANTSVSILIENCLFEGNNTSNNNRPQINMGPSGELDSTRILNNTVIGNRDLTMVGGISVSSLVGVPNKFRIQNNTIRDNRYGFTSLGISSGIIKNNIIEDNDTEVEPMNGGSGISLYNTDMVYISGNQIRRNLWGITLIESAQANLGSDDEHDFNPGGNVFSENGNGGMIYALFNNTPNEIKALHNCWIENQESTIEDVEGVISHVVDDSALGEVLFDPFECGIIMATIEEDSSQIFIYPNPAKEYFVVRSDEMGLLNIFDSTGKLVQTIQKDTSELKININLPKGIYWIEFESNSIKSIKKLVVK